MKNRSEHFKVAAVALGFGLMLGGAACSRDTHHNNDLAAAVDDGSGLTQPLPSDDGHTGDAGNDAGSASGVSDGSGSNGRGSDAGPGSDNGSGASDPGSDGGSASAPLPGDAPAGVILRSFAYAGSGCPANTVQGGFPVDGNHFVITNNPFTAEAGPNLPLPESRKNCQVLFDLDYPSGWQYSVSRVLFAGHAAVDADAAAEFGAAFYFQGSAQTTRFTADLVGADDRDVVSDNPVDDAARVWSTCDSAHARALNLNVTVRVTASNGARGIATFGAVTTDGASGATDLELFWRACTPMP